ncbi:MAG: outer membrane beta-barrel protein [Myxococcales bacterium]|nr:outer membrane beta-barrel protein [Myxococcales bacterium]MCB9523101.1 outer membrane beta-barrel protein [Myxococcales bacterium]
MTKTLLATAALALALPLTAQAAPKGNGFTAMAGLGFGIQSVLPDEGDSNTEYGVAIDLAAGGFIKPNLALLFRIDGTITQQDLGGGDDNKATYTHLLLGPAVQYWLNEKLWVSGTAGISAIRAEAEIEFLGQKTTISVDDNELGLGGGAGYVLWNSGEHTVYVGGDLSLGFHDGGKILSTAFTVGWQML